jgi:hypothetical protein
VSESSDWALVALTAVLSGATVALAYHTHRLVKVTKEVSEKSESRKIAPYLTFDGSQPLSHSGGQFARFSVKNIGSGIARNPGARAYLKDGKELQVKPHSTSRVVESGSLFYWDVYGVKTGDELEFNVVFGDIDGRIYAMKNGFIVS